MRCPHLFLCEPGSDCRECSEACKLGEAEPRTSFYARIHREAGGEPGKKRGKEKES